MYQYERPNVVSTYFIVIYVLVGVFWWGDIDVPSSKVWWGLKKKKVPSVITTILGFERKEDEFSKLSSILTNFSWNKSKSQMCNGISAKNPRLVYFFKPKSLPYDLVEFLPFLIPISVERKMKRGKTNAQLQFVILALLHSDYQLNFSSACTLFCLFR